MKDPIENENRFLPKYGLLPQYSNLPPPSFSNGWLEGFKKRHKLRSRIQHGEAGSVVIQAEEEMKTIATIPNMGCLASHGLGCQASGSNSSKKC
jgi:hypothetical protein